MGDNTFYILILAAFLLVTLVLCCKKDQGNNIYSELKKLRDMMFRKYTPHDTTNYKTDGVNTTITNPL